MTKNKIHIHMVGTTHFDPVWMWTWDEALASIRSTFRSALERMQESPDFIYSFSCPPVFEWIKNVDREMFEKIHARVQEGRWELVEGWWMQPDCNTASGESYVRHSLYGQRYLEKTFSKKSFSCFNTDSFGHNIMLPQILKKSGIENYVFGRPSPAEQDLPSSLFVWESPDGSQILGFRYGSDGANAYSQDVKDSIEALEDVIEKNKHDLIMLYGVSNHGGAPTKKAISEIAELALEKDKKLQVNFSSVENFFKKQDKNCLPKVKDELSVRAFGVFSNQTEVKKNNRLCEYALLNAEKFSLLAEMLTGRKYPQEKLKQCWEDTLFNQFHDILGGASIKDAYVDARNLHGRVLQTSQEIINYSLQAITKKIDTSQKGFPLVVWNPEAFSVTAPIEAELQWAWEFGWYKGPLKVNDSSGREIPVQVIQELSVIPAFRSRFVFKAEIPAFGYRVFYIQQEAQSPQFKPTIIITDKVIETRRYVIKISDKYCGLESVYDKKLKRQVLGNTAYTLIKQDDGDTWCFGYPQYGEVRGYFRQVSMEVLENGVVRTVIRIKGVYEQSSLQQDIILYEDDDTIEGKIKVNWREQHKVLKLKFDTLMSKPELTASVPYGSIVRREEAREMPVAKWLNLEENESGVAIISDSLFAYDYQDSSIGLTLLRSPIYAHLHYTQKGELDLSKDYEYMEEGVRTCSWRVKLHQGNWREAKIPEHAVFFNNPPFTITEANHPGTLPAENSYLKVEAQSSILTTMKKAEDGDDIIVRLYEYAGKKDKVKIALPFLSQSEYEIRNNKYEIKTLKIDKFNHNLSEVNLLEEESEHK